MTSAAPPELLPAMVALIKTLQETILGLRTDNQRLVAMVEGLTRQLDVLLADRAEETRAELQRLREEAAALAAAAPSPAGPALPADGAAAPPEAPAPTKPAPKRHNHGKGAIPAELERVDHQVAPAENCHDCGHDQVWPVETLVSEEYDFVRAYVRVRRTTRVVVECAKCHQRTVPPQPPMPFDRATCTFALMAWLLYSRGGLYIPLDRLGHELQRMGARIPSATLTRWWGRGADLLLPIAASVRLSLLSRTHIRTDGTGLDVLFPKLLAVPKRGEPREGPVDADGYLVQGPPIRAQVLVFGDDEHIVYHFAVNKEGSHIDDFLTLDWHEDGTRTLWKGTLTADAASVYDHLFVGGERIESGCNSHALRKFRDDAGLAPLLAAQAMHYIGSIFAFEKEAGAQKLRGPDLLTHRQTHARPVVEQLRLWLDTHLTDLLPKNPIRQAMQYYLNHWDALTRFLYDPDVNIDNNWSERALRKLALFRNASLFVGGEEGARRLCAVLTLVHTARQLDLDPCAYLEWALERVVPHPNSRRHRAADLTPAAYKATQEVQAKQA